MLILFIGYLLIGALCGGVVAGIGAAADEDWEDLVMAIIFVGCLWPLVCAVLVLGIIAAGPFCLARSFSKRIINRMAPSLSEED